MWRLVERDPQIRGNDLAIWGNDLGMDLVRFPALIGLKANTSNQGRGVLDRRELFSCENVKSTTNDSEEAIVLHRRGVSKECKFKFHDGRLSLRRKGS